MRKSKFRLHLIIAVSCITPLLCACFAKKTSVNIPEEYFLSWEINTWNQSAIHFNDNWTYWFWFFFLWTPIRQSDIVSGDNDNPIATLEHNWVKITCRSQLRWYYSTNFTNFWMFPIDEYTANKINNWVQFITWWLFTNCDDEDGNWTDEHDNWVYWYVKRQYGNNWENIHEIWAWITKTWWKFESELKLVESDDKKNIALSGIVYDSLAKRSQVVTNFFEKVYIKIPDEYFTRTKVFSWNVNEVFYSSEWYYWFWLFFLWTWIDGNFNVTDTSGVTLTCSKQVNWYHLINFNEFWMFPLDRNTESYSATKNNVRIQNWWLYYNCKKGNKVYTWVYWYLKWNYNLDNTHELRAWVDTYWHRKDESPLDIIYSENPWNTGVSLSGTFHTSLAKNWQAINRLFWDIGLIMSWENLITYSWKTLLIDYMAYKTNDIKMYVKSSVPWSDIETFIWRNTLWPNAHDRKYWYATSSQTWANENSLSMENTRSAWWFYWLYERDLARLTGFSNWYLYARVRQWDKTWKLQNIYFKLINETPEITIQKLPENVCSNFIKIEATADKLADTIKYIITGDDRCGSQTEFTGDYTWPIQIDNDELSGKFLCFRAENDIDLSYKSYMITGIDSTLPTVVGGDEIVFTGLECSTITWYIQAYDSGWCNINVQTIFEWDYDYKTWIFENGSILAQNFYFYASDNKIWRKKFRYTVKDSANNTVEWAITMERLDARVTWQNFNLCTTFTQKIIEWSWNRKELSYAGAWNCEDVTAKVLYCDKWKAEIIGDTVKYIYNTPSLPQWWYDKCTIEISDGDSALKKDMYVTVCRVSPVIEPQIVWGKSFIDRCYTWWYKQGEHWTFSYDPICNNLQNMPKTQPKQETVTKYTSWSDVIIDINKQKVRIGNNLVETAPIKYYRVSCIQWDSYCTKYETWWNDIWCDGIYSWYFENIWWCTWTNNTSNSCNYNKEWQKCKQCKLSLFWFCIARDDWEVQCSDSSTCRRWCREAPSSWYFEDILGCTYSDNSLLWQCISEDTWSLFGIINLWWNTNQNGRCWRWCSSNVIGRNDINSYTEECKASRDTLTDNQWWYKCLQMESPWTRWMPYDWNIYVDLEEMTWCSNYWILTPNGSKYQWQRTIWVQVEDTNSYRSEKTETDIVVYDIWDYHEVKWNWYSWWNTSPTLSYTNENITNTNNEINLRLTAEDAPLLYGIMWNTWQQTEKENILMDLYQKYISFTTLNILAKNLELSRIMKWICSTWALITATWTFTSHINDTCSCSWPTCSWDYHRFWLTWHIPAIDYWCEALSVYTVNDVTTWRYASNPNMVCNGELTGISCTPSTQRRTHEYSGENAESICNNACESANPAFWCFSNTWDNHIATTTCNVRYPKKTITLTWERIKNNTVKYTNKASTNCNNNCQSQQKPIPWCYNDQWTAITNCLWSRRNWYYYQKEIYTYQEQVDDTDHPIYYFYDHVITKTNCLDIWYDSCNVYSCTKYDNKNEFECSYKACTNFWSWCMSYETETYTGNSYIDSSCMCTMTKDYPEEYIPGTIDENKYRCIEITWDVNNEIVYQCYECIEYKCTRDQLNGSWNKICKDQAYVSWVTYFLVDQPQDYWYGSHLKVPWQTNIYRNNASWFIQLKLKLENWYTYNISNYNLNVRSNNLMNRQDKSDITISISNIPDYSAKHSWYCGYWNYLLTINQWFISDFALNGTNKLTEIKAPNTVILNPCTCKDDPVCHNQFYYSDNPSNLEQYCNDKANACDPKCICVWENANTQQCLCNENSDSYDITKCKACTDAYNQNTCNLFKAGQQKPKCEDPKEERDAYCSYPNHKDELECACRGDAAESKECKCTYGLCSYSWLNNICLNSNNNTKPHLCTTFYDKNNKNIYWYCNCNPNRPNDFNKANSNPERQTYCELYSNPTCNKTNYNCNKLDKNYVNSGLLNNLTDNGTDIQNREARCSCFTDSETNLRDYVDCQTNFNNNSKDYAVQCACSCQNWLWTLTNNDNQISTWENIRYDWQEEEGFDRNSARTALLTNDINYIEFDNGIFVNVPTEKPLCDWKITCEESADCPGFRCEFISESCTDYKKWSFRWADWYSHDTTCESKLSISVRWEFDKNGVPLRTGWTNCKVKLDAWNGNLWNEARDNTNWEAYTWLDLEFYLFTWEKTAFKVWIRSEEDYSKDPLVKAIDNLWWDKWFYFYNTQQQRIRFGWTQQWTRPIGQKTWVLWSVEYNIFFNKLVPDTEYHIWWKAIINGYQRELNIDVPTFNYENPAWYLSTFPEY